ncbi:MAG: twin-arginine translocase subunit TatC [Endomicrobia bacterium]|nr:twin-arginine translocase subunit TatC [Endomicrobiia bacterium]
MKMNVTEHLDELRSRLIRSAVYILAASAVALYFANDILYVLKLPSKGLIEGFLVLKPVESIGIYMKTAIFSGLAAAALPVFWEFFSFVKPAISEGGSAAGDSSEQNLSVLKWVAIAFTLFVSGVVFIYFIVLRPAISFLMSLSQGLTGTAPQITLTSYISFVCAMLFCGGMIFQIPLISFILTKIGVITPKLMSSKRKEAYFALCVFAAVVTPTTDAFSMALFVAPMIVLYEVGILFSKTVYKKKVFPGGEVYESK